MTIQSPEFFYLSPSELTLHAELNNFPALPDEQLATLTQSIKERGVLEPLICTPDYEVYGGRSRWRIAQVLELPKVPVLVRHESDVVGYAIETAIARRQLTKSAVVLFLMEQHPELAARRGKRGNPKLIPSQKELGTTTTYEELADRYRLPADYFRLFAEMREDVSKEDWEKIRDSVFNDEIPVTRIYAGWCGTGDLMVGGKGSTKIFKINDHGQLELSLGLFPRSIKSLKTCWELWDQDPRFHGPMLEQWTGMLEDIPDALVPATLKALQRRARK